MVNRKNYMKDYYKNNLEKYKEARKRFKEKNPHYKSPNFNKNMRKYQRKIYREIISLLGGKCVNPFNLNHGDFLTDVRCLQIDHIHGGGTKEKKEIGSMYKYYRFILKQVKAGSKEYQLLCANCNWIKRHINKENVK
jgi:hypothetical protein